MKKMKLLALMLSAMLLVTACADKAGAEVKEPVETPVVEEPVEETEEEKIAREREKLEAFEVQEIDLGVSVENTEDLSEEQLDKGVTLANSFRDYLNLNGMSYEHLELAPIKFEGMLVNSTLKNMEEAIAKFKETGEMLDSNSSDDVLLNEEADGSKTYKEYSSSVIGELLGYGYSKYNDTAVYVYESTVPVNKYATEDSEPEKVEEVKETYSILMAVEDGKLKVGWFTGDSKKASIQVLGLDDLIKYNLAQEGVLGEVKQDDAEKIMYGMMGEYWGTDESDFMDGVVGFDLRSAYHNTLDKSYSIVGAIYNNTDEAITGKHTITVTDFSIYKVNGDKRERISADLESIKSVYVDVDLKPGEYELYEIEVHDQNWIQQKKQIVKDFNNDVIDSIEYTADVLMHKIKE